MSTERNLALLESFIVNYHNCFRSWEQKLDYRTLNIKIIIILLGLCTIIHKTRYRVCVNNNRIVAIVSSRKLQASGVARCAKK